MSFTDQLNTLIRTRRSVFIPQFVPGKVIPDDLIWQLLENANWAPSHKQSEPWRFTVFTGAGLEKLAVFQAELYKELSGERFQQGKYNKLRNNPGQCSHVIAIALKRTAVRLPEVEEIEAVACAVQNLHLTAHAYGLGGYWSSGGVTYDEQAKAFFGLGPDDRLLGFFQLGYIEVAPDAGKRGPVAEKTAWVRE